MSTSGPFTFVLICGSIALTIPEAHSASRGFYNTDVVIQEPVGEIHRGALSNEVHTCIERSKIQDIIIDGTTIGTFERSEVDYNTIEKFPVTVLQALRLACTNPPVTSYWNVLLPQISGDAVPGAIFRPDKHRLQIRIGEPLSTVVREPAPSEAELRRRYEIGPLGSYGRSWEDKQRAALDQALSSLMLEERSFLKGIPFERRSHSGVQSRQKHVADYFQRGPVAAIYLYDKAFEHDGVSFAGTPQHPHTNSAFGILHEIGHLIASAPSLRHYRAAAELQRAYEGLYQEYELAYAAHAEAVEQYNNAQEHREPLAARVAHTESTIKAFEPRLQASLERTQAATRAGLRYQTNSPVVAEYKKTRTNRSGPTSYGRTDAAEGFAESFAIFHLDPQALKWIDPEVYHWFRMGRHLKHAQAHE